MKEMQMAWLAAAAAESIQSWQTLCDPTDSSPPGSAVPGILHAGTLEWVAISFSNAWKCKVKVKSYIILITVEGKIHQWMPKMWSEKKQHNDIASKYLQNTDQLQGENTKWRNSSQQVNQEIKVKPLVTRQQYYVPPNMMHWGGHKITSVIFLSKT